MLFYSSCCLTLTSSHGPTFEGSVSQNTPCVHPGAQGGWAGGVVSRRLWVAGRAQSVPRLPIVVPSTGGTRKTRTGERHAASLRGAVPASHITALTEGVS